MNRIHYTVGIQGYTQIFVDQFDAETTVVTRHNPQSHESVILVARTAFRAPEPHTPNCLQKLVVIPSRVDYVLVEANLETVSDERFYQNLTYINGLSNYKLQMRHETKFIDRIEYNGKESVIHFKYFPPGAYIVLKVVLNQDSLDHLPSIRNAIHQLTKTSAKDEETKDTEKFICKMSLEELNVLLFRCSEEETGEQILSDVYNIPEYGSLIYAGLQGFVSVLEKTRLDNNLGHPIFENLRRGDWMMEYIVCRLFKYHDLDPQRRQNLLAFALWLQHLFASVSKLPRYLIPAYFDLIISTLYCKALDRCWTLMSSVKSSNFCIVNGSSFLQRLALNSVLFVGHLRSALLPQSFLGDEKCLGLSLSAGLPHFSVSLFRNWGRDTFISVRGLLLLNNRFIEAKELILGYGSCLRHGLIPNLLGEGKCARYNARKTFSICLN